MSDASDTGQSAHGGAQGSGHQPYNGGNGQPHKTSRNKNSDTPSADIQPVTEQSGLGSGVQGHEPPEQSIQRDDRVDQYNQSSSGGPENSGIAKRKRPDNGVFVQSKRAVYESQPSGNVDSTSGGGKVKLESTGDSGQDNVNLEDTFEFIHHSEISEQYTESPGLNNEKKRQDKIQGTSDKKSKTSAETDVNDAIQIERESQKGGPKHEDNVDDNDFPQHNESVVETGSASNTSEKTLPPDTRQSGHSGAQGSGHQPYNGGNGKPDIPRQHRSHKTSRNKNNDMTSADIQSVTDQSGLGFGVQDTSEKTLPPDTGQYGHSGAQGSGHQPYNGGNGQPDIPRQHRSHKTSRNKNNDMISADIQPVTDQSGLGFGVQELDTESPGLNNEKKRQDKRQGTSDKKSKTSAETDVNDAIQIERESQKGGSKHEDNVDDNDVPQHNESVAERASVSESSDNESYNNNFTDSTEQSQVDLYTDASCDTNSQKGLNETEDKKGMNGTGASYCASGDERLESKAFLQNDDQNGRTEKNKEPDEKSNEPNRPKPTPRHSKDEKKQKSQSETDTRGKGSDMNTETAEQSSKGITEVEDENKKEMNDTGASYCAHEDETLGSKNNYHNEQPKKDSEHPDERSNNLKPPIRPPRPSKDEKKQKPQSESDSKEPDKNTETADLSSNGAITVEKSSQTSTQSHAEEETTIFQELNGLKDCVEDKGSFCVRIKILAEDEYIEKQIYLENVECYLKYQFVLKNAEAVGHICGSLPYEVIKENEFIYIKIEKERFTEKDYIKCITDFADRCNIVVNKWPLSGVDEKNVLLGLENEAKNNTLECLSSQNYLFVAYDNKNALKVEDLVKKYLNEHLTASQTCHSEIKIPYIFSILLDNNEAVEKCRKYIDLTWKILAENDEVHVNFEGKETNVLKAMKHFDKYVIKSYGVVRFSCGPFELKLLHEFLEKTYNKDTDTDLLFAINETKKSVWCCSRTSQANAEEALHKAKMHVQHKINKDNTGTRETSGKKGLYYVKESEKLHQGCKENEIRLSQELTLSVSLHDSEAVKKAVEETQNTHKGHVDITYEVCKGPSNSPKPVPKMEKCLEDYRYLKWKLDSNSTLYCVEKILELPGFDLVIVPMETAQKENQTGQQIIGKKYCISIPDRNAPKAKAIIRTEVQESLNKLPKKKSYRLDVLAVPIKAWDKYRYIKPIFYELCEWVKQLNNETEAVIVMLCSDSDAFITLSDILIEAVGVEVDVRKPLSKHHYQGDFKVVVERGEIATVKADVVVNPVGSDLNLNKGDVSRSIFGSAGKDLSDELRKIKPEGIKFGDSVVTESFLMKNCNYIVHGALDCYKGQSDLQKMEDLVLKCFEKANRKRCFSIAMPTIGLGNLDYSKEDVAEVMFGAVRKYYRDQHPSYLRCVKFVVFHKNKDVFKEFQKHEKRWSQFMEHQKASVIYSGIRLQFEHGSIARPGTDAAIYLWNTTKPFGKLQNSHLLKSYGDDVRKAIESKVKTKPGELQRHKYKDVRAELYFMPCDHSDECSYEVVSNCMLTADENKVNSISIVFDTENSLVMTPGRMKALCGVIKDVSTTTRYLTSVVILVESDSDVERLFQDFKSVQTALSNKNNEDKVQITICGFEEEVTGVVDMLKTRFLPLLVNKEDNFLEPDPVQENEEESITSNQNARNKTSDKEIGHIQFSKKFANYVEVLEVPKDLDKNGLKLLIFEEGKFPIPAPKLIYCKGSEKALLICQSKEDADKLAGFKDLEPFVFRKIQGKGLSSWSVQIPHKVQQLQDNESYIKWKTELESADIEVQTGSQPRIIAPTSYQSEYFIQSLEKFGLLFDKSSQVGATSAQHSSYENFTNITRIPDIAESVWDILTETDEYAQLKRKCETLTYQDQTIIIDPGEKSLSQEIKEFEENVKSLKDKELHEIDIKPEFEAKVDAWCKEISGLIGYDCCKYIRKKNKVVAFCNEYDDFARVKHILGTKTGGIKVTGKGRRRGKINDTEEIDKKPVNRKKSFDLFDWKKDANNVQRFETTENIQVFVYEANILRLPVVCIVNAANETLSHGGGVAAVIERAAGQDLTREGNQYIRRNGKLSVGGVCSTTAGNLHYDCVIHAVGPRWSDYHPYTLQQVHACESHLRQAIYNSLIEAENSGLTSIAFPAISSAIFGVPEELCVYQYAQAVLSYSKRSTGMTQRLKEIHFIDKNPQIVCRIQDMFGQVFSGECNFPYYDSSKFVKKKRRHEKQLYPVDKHKSMEKEVQTLPEPKSFFHDKALCYVYLLCGHDQQKLLLKGGDILDTIASSIVISVDETGRYGSLGEALNKKIKRTNDYTRAVSYDCNKKEIGDVFLTGGFGCRYGHIIHAIFPVTSNNEPSQQRMRHVEKMYTNIFQKCSEMKLPSVVTTLLGTGNGTESDLRLCAEKFLQTYTQTCFKGSLEVHLVCRDSSMYNVVKDVLDKYIQNKKNLSNSAINNDQPTEGNVVEKIAMKKESNEHESCVICMDSIDDPKTLGCGHTFCTECIHTQFKFKQSCPTCGKVCGTITGDQPDGGRMNIQVLGYTSCAGYDGCGQIIITYYFPGGRQGPNHPQPGKWYKGITRMAYLPDNAEGRQIMKMLKLAFARKLVFTIGNSRTTGEEGVITWNDIHHKTNPRPYGQFGYPDQGYLERVKDEIAAKGITEKDIEDD